MIEPITAREDDRAESQPAVIASQAPRAPFGLGDEIQKEWQHGKGPSVLGAVGRLGISIVMQIGAGVAGIVAFMLAGAANPERVSTGGMPPGFLVFATLVAAVSFFLVSLPIPGRGGTLRWFGRPKSWMEAALIPLAVIPLMFGLTIIIGLIYQALNVQGEQQLLTMIRAFDEPMEYLPLAFVAVLLVPIAEEAFFRGYVLSALTRKWGVIAGVVVSAAVFAAVHLEPVALIPTFLIGAVLAVIRLRTGVIWTGVFLHAINNLLAFVVARSSIGS